MKYLTLVPLKFKVDEKLASAVMIELPSQWVKHNDEGRMKTKSLVMRILAMDLLGYRSLFSGLDHTTCSSLWRIFS